MKITKKSLARETLLCKIENQEKQALILLEYIHQALSENNQEERLQENSLHKET